MIPTLKVAGVEQSSQEDTEVQYQNIYYLKMLGIKRIRQETLDG